MEQTAEVDNTRAPLFSFSAVRPLTDGTLAGERTDAVKDTSLPSYRILVVDDESSFLELMLPLLQNRHPMVDTASNGRQAQKLIDRWRYDLVITDLHMPDVDGLELLQWIKRKHMETAVILMTGEIAQESKAEKNRNMGAADVLTKPFSSEQMFEAVERCLNRRSPPVSATEQVSLLAKPLIHGIAEGLENTMTRLKILQRAFKTARVDAAIPCLDPVIADLFRLMGLTEKYCSLFLHLDNEGEIPIGRFDLQADTIDVVLKELAEEIGRKKISIIFKRDKYAAYHPRPVQANRILLSSVFRTLFTYAVNHCCEDGTITYGFSANEKEHRVRISYAGQLPTDITNLADQAVVKTGNGTGYGNGSQAFGISAACSVIRHFGGNLTCKADENNSTFFIALPKLAPLSNGSHSQ